jgi:hypothetical protein
LSVTFSSAWTIPPIVEPPTDDTVEVTVDDATEVILDSVDNTLVNTAILFVAIVAFTVTFCANQHHYKDLKGLQN